MLCLYLDRACSLELNDYLAGAVGSMGMLVNGCNVMLRHDFNYCQKGKEYY